MLNSHLKFCSKNIAYHPSSSPKVSLILHQQQISTEGSSQLLWGKKINHTKIRMDFPQSRDFKHQTILLLQESQGKKTKQKYMLLKKTHTTQVSKLSELNPYQAEIALCWIAVVISEAPIYYCRVLLNTAVKKVI